MSQDWWVHEWVEALARAKTAGEIQDLIEQMEDRFDAFSGPGEDLVEALLVQARKRLANLS